MTSKPDNQNSPKSAGRERISPDSVDPHGSRPFGLSRRRFLETAGFTLSLTALHGCSRPDPELALPLLLQPEGVIPGKLQTYASTCAGCPAGCGLLVGVRDGRPLKMEGMPEHPLSHGGLCAVGQALPLGLYDRQRLQQPLHDGQPTDWKSADEQITKTLNEIADSGGTVRFVTSTVTGPTLQTSIDAFLERFSDARHITFDSVSCSAISDAHEQTHGRRQLPHYRFDRATVIVSFGADFLGTWISPVEFTAAWRKGRVPTPERPEMSYHAHFEGHVTLTGSNADRRYRIAPDEYSALLNRLYTLIAQKAGRPADDNKPEELSVPEAELNALAERLWSAGRTGLVICDSQDMTVQVVVNAINHLLDSYETTLSIEQPSRQRQGSDADVVQLISELKEGRVDALFVADTDLVYNLPDQDALAEAIRKVKLVVSLSERENDTTAAADFVCPDHHPLESWMDAEAVAGVISLRQPLLQPLGSTRSILESLAQWTGEQKSAYDILRSSWKSDVFPRAEDSGGKAFREFWDQSVHDGFVRVRPADSSDPVAPKPGPSEADRLVAADKWLQSVDGPTVDSAPSDYCLTLTSRIGLTDSRHAHNPWLQELPDPITKVVWDNYVSISPTAAGKLGVSDGDVVQITVGKDTRLELPALIQRGQHDRVISVDLNYGVPGTQRFADIGPQWFEAKPTVDADSPVGKNAAPLIRFENNALRYERNDVSLKKTGKRHILASTQTHHTLEIPPNVAPSGAEVRDIVQLTTLSAFTKNPEAGRVEHHFPADTQLWSDDHSNQKPHWGMAIDLNACTGCSACLVACQSENNVPVVGKDEVQRQREMHWLRIDRYYAGDEDDLQVSHQPMMCQHCDNAPCETVCPVLATVHSDEGLNEQVYNRCVGTRYCANNCPYKVRRFNWFDYPHDDSLVNLALNPDVAVRSRGVMEKCTFCVHRVEKGRKPACAGDSVPHSKAIRLPSLRVT